MKSSTSALVWFAAAICAAHYGCNPSRKEQAKWRDPSPHSIQFVTVDKNVRLEVLDWGGTRRPLVLLAGLGNTAHVFDDFAPKLIAKCHVYGITRRGFGTSSSPEIGYSADRLGDDVMVVLDSLKLNRPVLVGHSIAGEELSSVGTRRPERIGGLIYLEAGYSYAYYDSSQGDFEIDLGELHRKLEQLQKLPADDLAKWKEMIDELLQKNLPLFEKDLKALQKQLQATPVTPTAAATAHDVASFPAFRSWLTSLQGVSFPEAELRQVFEAKSDGAVGKQRMQPSVARAISAGGQRYTDIRVPVLAIYAVPDDSESSAAKAFETGILTAQVVRLPHANHYVFLTNETDVLREMSTFLGSLP